MWQEFGGGNDEQFAQHHMIEDGVLARAVQSKFEHDMNKWQKALMHENLQYCHSVCWLIDRADSTLPASVGGVARWWGGEDALCC